MFNLEQLTDWYYFREGKIYFSKRNNTRNLFQAEVVFAKKDELFICVKNRYSCNHQPAAFITRKGFIDYVQNLYNQVPHLCHFANMEFISPESFYQVDENSPIHLIKNRWQ